MLSLFKKRPTALTRSLPVGTRAYAIGDVHGCLDLLQDLLARIEADHRARGPGRAFVIFLGDLVDRGPDSRGVLEHLRTYGPPGIRPIFLMGNHEEFFLRILEGDAGLVNQWLGFGGYELALSYGLGAGWLLNASSEAVAQELIRVVPRSHRDFVRSFADSFRVGDYLFVHAGIRPGVPIEEQQPSDTRWIRKGFLDSRSEHGVLVVHGHTVSDEPDEQFNRIGIDTGAYKGGPLTAIALEREERRFMVAQG